MNKKRGQMQIGFGVIFSIILIIIFIAFAVYGIGKFLEVQRAAQIASFENDFQNDVNRVIRSTSISDKVEYQLPNMIKQVCFKDSDIENMYFMTNKKDMKGKYITGIDIRKTLNGQRKFCIYTNGGEAGMTLKKEYNENAVTITK